MSSILVEREKIIERSVDVVRSQFADMEHHQSANVHATLQISNLRLQARNSCMLTARRRVLGMQQVDEMEVTRHPDGSITLHSLAGSNRGLVVTQTFEAEGPQSTRVKTRVEVPLRGVWRLLAPLVKKGVEKDTDIALEEDKVDLEHGAYATKINGAARE